MQAKVQPFTVQLVGDSTDVFGSTFGAQVPVWFRPKRLRLQVLFSDSDALHSLRVAGYELGRSSGPHIAEADNVQAPDWRKPHYVIPVPSGVTDFEILLDHNAVTAGVGLAVLQWEG